MFLAAISATMLPAKVLGQQQGDVTLPYQQDFATAEGFKDFTAIDGNNDGVTWYHWQPYQNVYSGVSFTDAADDYLVSPGVYLEPGKMYRFSLDIIQRGETYAEDFELLIGNAPTVEALSTVIYEHTVLADGKTHRPIADVMVDKAAVYYFAVHIFSPRGRYGVYVDNVSIEEGVSMSAPDYPTLNVITDPKGENRSTVEVTAPSKTVDGKDLTSITKLEVARDGKILKTFNNPTPGSKLSFVDEIGEGGYFNYSATAYNENGTGRCVEKRVFIGVNYPSPVTNIVAMQTANPGEVKVSWTPPTTDTDGNPLNPDLVSYIVATKRQFENLRILGSGIKDNSYTFRFCDADADQTFEYFYVIPCTSKGNNDWDLQASQLTAVGRPYELPFAETFGSETQKYITDVSNTLSKWEVSEEIYDQDGDDKYLYFASYVGHSGEVITGVVGLDCESPVFSFWYLCQEDGTETFDIYVNADGNGFKKIDEISIASGKHRQWTNHLTSLKEFKGQDVQVKVLYTCTGYRPAIDNFEIYNLSNVDLEIADYSYPRMVRPGVAADFGVEVRNLGAGNPGRFSVELIRDNKVVSTASVDGIEFYDSKVVKLTDVYNTASTGSVEYSININCPEDEITDNNTVGPMNIAIVKNSYPSPSALTAKENGSSVELTWTAPETSMDYITVTDGAEDYPAFAIGMSTSAVREDHIGDWTMVDRDGLYTNVMANGDTYLNYPNLAQPMGFIIFDHAKASCPDYLSEFFCAHSGKQSFACIGAMNGGTNDDWLISPELSGRAQTVTFYAKSAIVSYGRETIEFMYSTTDTNPDSFILAEEGAQEPPALWMDYSFNLPAGTKYFAIHCNSENKYLLLVDDITFEAKNANKNITLSGYNVYCDGARVNDAPVATAAHVHNGHDGAVHTYHVTAVYEEGESSASNPAEVGSSAIDDTFAGQNTPVVTTEPGLIIVDNPNAGNVYIYNTLGHLVTSGNAMRITAEVTPGLYIVKAGSTTVKAIVR